MLGKNNRIKAPLQQKIALIFLGVFLALIILETGLRLSGFIILSLQQRRNMLRVKEKGAFRILCLGESTTQNQYPPFLEEILNKSNAGIRFSVIDEGKAGTNTSRILNEVESYLDKYRPDMVVAMMGINDCIAYISYDTSISSNKCIRLMSPFKLYKLARLLWFHMITKAKEMRFIKLPVDKQNQLKRQSELYLRLKNRGLLRSAFFSDLLGKKLNKIK